jgi:hypothetical protein
MPFNALSAAKFVVSGIVGLGTGKIVGKIIKDHVTPDTLIEKVTVTAAAWAISGLVTKHTKQYTDDMIDETVETVTKITEKVKSGLTLAKVNRGEMTFQESGLNPEEFIQNEKGEWVRKPDKTN